MATAGPPSPLTTPAGVAAAPPVPELHWTDCGEGFQCATAQVPLDYDHPRGPTISLALSRLPARDPSRKIGSLILGAGGPGESGVDLLRRAVARGPVHDLGPFGIRAVEFGQPQDV